MRITAAILILASGCAQAARRDGVGTQIHDYQIHDYRQTRDVPVALTVSATPRAVVVANPADSVPFTGGTVARRLKTGYVAAAYSGSRKARDGTIYALREIRFYDDSGRLVSRIGDTTWTSTGFTPPINRLIVLPDQSIVAVTATGKWMRIDSSHHVVARDSMTRFAFFSSWVGLLNDGSVVGRIREMTPSKPPSKPTVSVEPASFIRVATSGKAQYLPMETRELLLRSSIGMPPEVLAAISPNAAGKSVSVTFEGRGSAPQIAQWPVRPSVSAIAGGNSIWDFDIVGWQVYLYDSTGNMKSLIRPPIPPANVGASLAHPVWSDEAWTLQTMLDDSGRLWMEPFDTPKPPPVQPTPRGQAAPLRTSTSRMWGFSTDGVLLGSIDIPKGLRVLEIGDDFLLGLQQDASGVIALVTYALHPVTR